MLQYVLYYVCPNGFWSDKTVLESFKRTSHYFKVGCKCTGCKLLEGWKELQTASFKFRGDIIVLNRQKSKTISCERLYNFKETGCNIYVM